MKKGFVWGYEEWGVYAGFIQEYGGGWVLGVMDMWVVDQDVVIWRVYALYVGVVVSGGLCGVVG